MNQIPSICVVCGKTVSSISLWISSACPACGHSPFWVSQSPLQAAVAGAKTVAKAVEEAVADNKPKRNPFYT